MSMATPDLPSRALQRVRSGVSPILLLRHRFVEAGLDTALARPPPARTKPFTRHGAQEARLGAIAGRQVPEGRASWTRRLLADKLVDLALVVCVDEGPRPLEQDVRTPHPAAAGRPERID
jgi:hypothetical protein